ncbi:MAG: hypothetical protein FJ293_00540 [Planctomycetes bacterium]|nr:hypothetical protein [Planctomycetota bacterium]
MGVISGTLVAWVLLLPAAPPAAAAFKCVTGSAPVVAADPGEELAEFGSALDAKEWNRAIERVAAPAKQTRATVELHASVLAAAVKAGAEGEKFVVRALEWKHITDAEQPLAAALGALGARPEPKRIELYGEYLNDLRIPVARAAIIAMGNFFGEKEALRKKVVAQLVRAYDGTGMGGEGSGRQRNDPKSALGQPGDRMAVRHDFQYQLARLTGGVHFSDANDWVAWFGANDKTKWRDGVDKPDIKLDGLKSGPAPGSGGR